MEAGTAERTAYFNAMRAMGAMTINEIREKEDLPRSDDPKADQLTPAANMFGQQPPASNDQTQDDPDANN